jgi:hypothetical protein
MKEATGEILIGCTTIEPSRTGCLRSMLKAPVYLLQKKKESASLPKMIPTVTLVRSL